MARGMDSEAGGAADLQTDVMRFMAILSLCLMVIFAVVQSAPVETIPTETVAETVTAETATVEPETVNTPTPAPATPQPRAQEALETTAKATPAQPPAQPMPPPAQPVTAEEAPEGFTLRFENDRALTRLVARDEIGLYAISPSGAMRMTINQDKAEFWSVTAPAQYHEMDAATVPAAVIRAFNASSTSDGAAIKWGVTLPSVMSGKLNTYMREYRGGSLVIGADGVLAMEIQ